MNKYYNDFTYGRERLKKLMIGTILCCVISLFMAEGSSYRLICLGLGIALLAYSMYTIKKYCRCPHCGKTIYTGILTVKTCPNCKRSLETGKKMKKSKK